MEGSLLCGSGDRSCRSWVEGVPLRRAASTDLKTTAQGGFGGQFLLAGARSSGLFQKGGSRGSFAPQETETLPSPLSGARVTAGIQRIEARDASSSALRCAGQPHGTAPWQRISGLAPNVDRAEFETPAVEGIPALHCFRAEAKPLLHLVCRVLLLLLLLFKYLSLASIRESRDFT